MAGCRGKHAEVILQWARWLHRLVRSVHITKLMGTLSRASVFPNGSCRHGEISPIGRSVPGLNCHCLSALTAAASKIACPVLRDTRISDTRPVFTGTRLVN